MKKLVSYLFLFFCFFTSFKVEAQDPNFHIYLMFGQSNMEGQGPIEAQDRVTNPRVRLLQDQTCSNLNRTYGVWYTAAPPLVRCWGRVGPGDSFAKTMANNTPSNITIGIVNTSVGGCDISLFQKGAPTGRRIAAGQGDADIPSQFNGGYAWMLDLAKKAQTVGVIKGILFHQGETNTNDQAWKNKVQGIVSDLKKDLSLGDIPFLAGELLYKSNGGPEQSCCSSHNTEINKLPGIIPNAHVISASGLMGQDVAHFTTAAYREFGIRYATKMLELVSTTTTCTPTPIDPYLQVNGGTWTNTSTAELCAGGTVSFGPHPYDVETGWTWTGPANFTATTREITLSNLAANKSGTYVATLTNGTCSAKQNFTLTINALPVATVTAPSTSFCAGSSLTISSSNATSYVWKKGVDQVATSQTYNVTSGGSYTVEVTDAKGCKGVSSVTQITQTTASTWYADTDGDGFGDANSKMEACTKPTGYVSNSTDQCPTDINKTLAGNCGCGKTEQSCLDCNGTPNGTAITDNCGRCVGGTTSKQACKAKIEAELACDFNGVVESNNVGFLGTGFVNTTNAINSSVAVVLNVTQSGNYTIGYRYALGGTTARGATVLVNRIEQKTMTFAPTGAFTTYGTEEVSLSLKAGDNIVRLASLTTAGTANIDLIYWNSAAISEATNCDLVTGLYDTEFANSNWKVYPNPFTNTFLISKEGVQAEYKIFSIKGELVQSGVLDNSVVLGEGLSSGVYELKLIEADKVSSLKLIKQ